VCNLEMTGELTLQIQPVLWLYHLRRTRDRQISGMLDVLLLVQNTWKKHTRVFTVKSCLTLLSLLCSLGFL